MPYPPRSLIAWRPSNQGAVPNCRLFAHCPAPSSEAGSSSRIASTGAPLHDSAHWQCAKSEPALSEAVSGRDLPLGASPRGPSSATLGTAAARCRERLSAPKARNFESTRSLSCPRGTRPGGYDGVPDGQSAPRGARDGPPRARRRRAPYPRRRIPCTANAPSNEASSSSCHSPSVGMLIGAGASSSTIVPTPCASAIVAPLAFERLTKNASFPRRGYPR